MTTRRRRARTDAEKGERRMDILGAALELFESAPSALATVAAVAERAGLAKGTVYLYFTSREAIYLALLEDQLHAWLARFEDALPPMGEPMPTHEPHTAPPADATAEAATAFCAYPLTHRSMLRLASLANALLERNIEAAAALRFRRGFLQRMTTLGSRLDALWNLAPGTGRELLHQGYALLLGLWQLEEPAPVILEVMSGDEIETFGADFERRAVAAVRSLWRGAVASSTVP
jgi:AcrR family transcriptional regulator